MSAFTMRPTMLLCKRNIGADMSSGEVKDHVAEPAPDGGGRVDPDAAPKPLPISRKRKILVYCLIGLTTLLLVVAIFAVWTNRLLFSPTNWSNTSTQLLQSPTIRSATANYTTDQLYANVDVAGLIKSGLPPRLQPLASPAAGALRSAAVQSIDFALQRPRVQNLWAKANYAADQTFVTIATGGKGPVGVNQGTVTLNLASIVDDIASRLGLPPNLSAKLPKNIAHLTVFKSDQLKYVQNIGAAIRHLALWLTVLVPLLYALAIFLARDRRRRMLMNVGFAAVVGGALVILLRSLLVTNIAGALTEDASLRPAITDAVSIMTQMLHQIAAACIVVGVPLVIAAWFAGPARPARASRLAIAPSLREHPVGWYLGTLGVMVLIFIVDPIHATGTPAGIIVFTLLALFGIYLLRRQTVEEFPAARLGDATARVRAWVQARRSRREQPTGASVQSQPTMLEQLQQLADMRERGAITSDEYRIAKAQLLHG